MADDDDYDVVGNDEVVDALRDVEKAIKEKWSGQWSGVVVCVVLLWAWYVVKDIWHSKWRLGLTYDVSSDKVLVDKTPHDCAFLAAPMGEKYCHYDRVVTTLRWSRRPTASRLPRTMKENLGRVHAGCWFFSTEDFWSSNLCFMDKGRRVTLADSVESGTSSDGIAVRG